MHPHQKLDTSDPVQKSGYGHPFGMGSELCWQQNKVDGHFGYEFDIFSPCRLSTEHYQMGTLSSLDLLMRALSLILLGFFYHPNQQPTRPRFLGLRLRLRPDPCLVETRDWDWDLKVSEVETETETDHFWSRPRLKLRLAHGFISKSGATYFKLKWSFST